MSDAYKRKSLKIVHRYVFFVLIIIHKVYKYLQNNTDNGGVKPDASFVTDDRCTIILYSDYSTGS